MWPQLQGEDAILKVGDKGWLVVNREIAIRVSITEVQDWRKIIGEPDGAVYYWVDEPIGHEVDYGVYGEIYPTKEAAAVALWNHCHNDEMHYLKSHSREAAERKVYGTGISLDEWRTRSLKWILHTHLNNIKDEQEADAYAVKWWEDVRKSFRNKEYLVEWYTIQDLIAGKVMR